MAARAVAINRAGGGGPGLIAAAFVAAVILGPVAAVLWRAGGGGWPGPADWAALRFTLTQATLSALISVALAIPAARALARRRFAGRRLLITALGAPFILPVIVAVLGLLAVFGRSGALNTVLYAAGLPTLQIYGLHGVVLAHVFFNLPLATRIILQGWQSIPAERFRLTASLGMNAGQVMRHLEWPMLRAVLPGALMVIFAICLSSFAVALTLGGGPSATTVELAIYQAFRFDFDLGRAAVLACIQLSIVTVAAILALRVAQSGGFGAGLDRSLRRFDAETPALRLLDAGVLLLVALFLLTPMAAIVMRGGAALLDLPGAVWRAAGISLAVAGASMALTLALALPMALAALKRPMIEAVGLLGIAASPLVIGVGLFVLINPWTNPMQLALPVTALVNAVMALPFALRVMTPQLIDINSDFGNLCDSLGMSPRDRLRLVVLPRLRRQLGFAAGLAAALSIGDLGVIALFADPEIATLPLQILRLMGAYRMADAAGAGLLLLVLSLSVFWLLDQGGRADSDA
ncbi:MAG: ABC transporter permease subunit [Sediminimonas sp.]|uniref:ABC transporter permease subunit n=1 Tax=Sediminimonas sp. TaxID=2823379 RepID=UPI00286FD083|nr:ABC transporter permease subunit [Sediminimonas sp.]MDR9484913.1 ABC transporter permease subunit [Sediminimonas sp.]